MGKVFKRGSRWGISYYDPAGRQVRRMVADSRAQASRVLKKIETQIYEGRYFDKKGSSKPVCFVDFTELYLELHVKVYNKKSAQEQLSKIRVLKRYFADKSLSEITPKEIKTFISKRLKTVKPATINKLLALLQSMFNRAIEWGYWHEANPLIGIKKLPEDNERVRFLSELEEAKLLKELYFSPMARAMTIVALGTGMRFGEIRNLKRSITPECNYVSFKGEYVFIAGALSKSGRPRKIPLKKEVKEVLLEMPAHPSSDYFFFNEKTGKPIGSIEKAFNSALIRAGIEDFTFHDCRHSFASRLAMAGVSLVEIRDLLGHQSIRMTERYAHLMPSRLKDSVDKIELQLGEKCHENAEIKHVLSTMG